MHLSQLHSLLEAFFCCCCFFYCFIYKNHQSSYLIISWIYVKDHDRRLPVAFKIKKTGIVRSVSVT